MSVSSRLNLWRSWAFLGGAGESWKEIYLFGKKNLLKTKLLKWKKPYSKTLRRCCWSKKSILEWDVSLFQPAGERWGIRRGRGTAATAPVTQPVWPHQANLEMDPCLALVPCHPHCGTPVPVPFSQKWPPRTRSFKEQMPQAEGVFATAGLQKLLCTNPKQDGSRPSTASSSRKWAP